MTRNQQNTNQVLQAIRLGWLSVETFGRLRHWAKTGREPSGSKGDAMRRFNFSDRDPSQYHQLMIALEQLHTASTQLLPKVPSPIPQHPKELLQRAKEDIDEVWLEFEKWSREIWIALQVENPLAGRAFTYGGSLADTYWHAEGAGLDQLPGLLRAQRLENIAARFDSLYDHLPTHTTEVIHHSLYRWRIADLLKSMDEDEKKKILVRLEAQSKVWKDLLFGLQRPENYMLVKDRRRVAWVGSGSTALLVILVGLLVWLSVLLLAGFGRTMLASASGVTTGVSIDSTKVIEELVNYQNWSSLLATLSSVVVLLTGIITRLSGWIINFNERARNWLVLKSINRRTYREWDLNR